MNYSMREILDLLRGNPDIAIDDAAIHRPVIGSAAPGGKMSEHELQAAVIAECDRRSLTDPRYGHIFHPASGELRDKATAAKLKRMGVRRGLLDLYLIYPSNGYGGWAAELKVGKNRPTPEQHAEMKYLRSVGWQVGCFWDDPQWVLDDLARYLGATE